jgi:hypothetical protein
MTFLSLKTCALFHTHHKQTMNGQRMDAFTTLTLTLFYMLP